MESLALLALSLFLAHTSGGSVSGTIKDPSGGSVPSAKLTLTNA
jgi:hypothetical protein